MKPSGKLGELSTVGHTILESMGRNRARIATIGSLPNGSPAGEVQCPGCKKTLRVPDVDSARSVKCPACGKQLRIPPAMTIGGEKIDASSWRLRDNDGTEYGPYLFEEISAFVSEQRVIATTEINHLEATKGKWILAAHVASIAELLARAPVDVIAPPVVPPEQAPQTSEIEAATFESFTMDKLSRSVSPSRSSLWQFLFDFFDPTFKRYITPTVAVITWWIVLALTAITLVLAVISLAIYVVPGAENVIEQQGNLRERPRIAPPSISPPVFLRRLISAPVIVVIQAMGSCLTLLWVRVLLELCVVVFHFATSLKAIETNAFNRAKYD